MLRDFHVDNLLRTNGECAVLDYQDARTGPAAYDVVSLLEDARRDVSPGTTADALDRYFRRCPDTPRAAFDHHYRTWGAQRHAKVLGIFTRLWLRDGKPAYLAHLPRGWRLLQGHLDFPPLAPVRAWLAQHGADPAGLPPAADRARLCRRLGIGPDAA